MNQQEMLKVSDEVDHIELRLAWLESEIREYRGNSQWFLREFVTNKSFPLHRRFEIWEKHCEKITTSEEGDFGLIGKLIEAGDHLGGSIINWVHIIWFIDTVQDEREEWSGFILDLTVDDVKEALIEENFGSCRMEY